LNGTTDENIIDLSQIAVKPGIYTIEYVYTDGISTASAVRTFVVVSGLGDVNMDNIANYLDADLINQNDVVYNESIEGRNTADARLHYYRTADVNKDNIANYLDADLVNQGVIVSFYKALSL